MVKKKLSLPIATVVFLTLGPLATSRSEEPKDHGEQKSSAQIVTLNQGWDNKTRSLFYHTPQGSRLMPYTWFLSIDSIDGKVRFSDNANLVRYGFIPSPYKGEQNPDGLPIGFAIDRSQKAAEQTVTTSTSSSRSFAKSNLFIGLTCAACHTSEVTVRGKRLILDGAPARLDFDLFFEELNTAVRATLYDPARFAIFAKRVLGTTGEAEVAQLRLALATFETQLSGEATIRHPRVRSGFGRVDALTQIVNSLAVLDQKQPLNLRDISAPTSYPALWLTPQFEFVQWNPIAASPLARNGGEVLGVFGSANLSRTGNDAYKSTILIPELRALEGWVTKLEPPKWDETVFGAIDRNLARTGNELFLRNCSGCHSIAPYERTDPADNLYGKTFIKIGRVNYKEIGTDPAYHEALLRRYILNNEITKGLFDNKEVVSAPVYFMTTVGKIMNKAMNDARLTEAERVEANGYRLRKGPNGQPISYTPPSLQDLKASPLAAIWATGPYLHNGSVPTVYELLSPESERRKVFWTGAKELDREHLGFVSTDAPGRFRFDTSVPGNSNKGHNYPPIGLTHKERMAIIEFLKTQ